MRIIAVIFFVLTVVCAVDTVREQHSGVATASAPRGLPLVAHKQDDPAHFWTIIGYEWFRVGLCLGAGLVFRQIAKTTRRLDPFSTDGS